MRRAPTQVLPHIPFFSHNKTPVFFLQSMKGLRSLLRAWVTDWHIVSAQTAHMESTHTTAKSGSTATKNCYSWGQIIYFCEQAQTWPPSSKLQWWLIGSLLFKKCGLLCIPRMLSSLQFWLRLKGKMSHLPQGPIFTLTSQPHQYIKPWGDVIHFWLVPSSPSIYVAHAFWCWDHAELKSLAVKSLYLNSELIWFQNLELGSYCLSAKPKRWTLVVF